MTTMATTTPTNNRTPPTVSVRSACATSAASGQVEWVRRLRIGRRISAADIPRLRYGSPTTLSKKLT
jgi:hypothetical protein